MAYLVTGPVASMRNIVSFIKSRQILFFLPSFVITTDFLDLRFVRPRLPTDSDEPFHVIKAMKPDSTASQQINRFSLDISNNLKEIEQTVVAVQFCVRALVDSH